MKSVFPLGRLVAWVFLFAVTAVAVIAQDNSGSLQGKIKDEKGAAIVGAEVTATSKTLVRPQTTTSDTQGAYVFSSLPPGLYTVTVSQSGFSTIKKEEI